MVAACVAITDCITSLPSAFSTATEMVLWWTSRPIYLMLSIGCSFRQAWFTASHSNHNLLRKGRPFIMRAPPNLLLVGWDDSMFAHATDAISRITTRPQMGQFWAVLLWM